MNTPIPWEISRTSDPDGGLWIEADGAAIAHLSKELEECFSPIEDNAEFIVNACNSHDELMGALEHAEEILNTLENFDIEQVENSIIRACADQVSKALRIGRLDKN